MQWLHDKVPKENWHPWYKNIITKYDATLAEDREHDLWSKSWMKYVLITVVRAFFQDFQFK